MLQAWATVFVHVVVGGLGSSLSRSWPAVIAGCTAAVSKLPGCNMQHCMQCSAWQPGSCCVTAGADYSLQSAQPFSMLGRLTPASAVTAVGMSFPVFSCLPQVPVTRLKVQTVGNCQYRPISEPACGNAPVHCWHDVATGTFTCAEAWFLIRVRYCLHRESVDSALENRSRSSSAVKPLLSTSVAIRIIPTQS